MGTTPPAWALRHCFREVSDRAKWKMVCYARAISLMWMILRASRRREAESLYDRAQAAPFALVVVRFVSSWMVALVGAHPSSAGCAHDRTAFTQSDRVSPHASGTCATTLKPRDPTASCHGCAWEGASVPRGGAPGRSKRLARSARLAACKPKGDDEWNARDRPPNQNAVAPRRSAGA